MLVVADRPDVATDLERGVQPLESPLEIVGVSPDAAVRELAERPVDLVVCAMQDGSAAIELLSEMGRLIPEVARLMLCGDSSVPANEAMQQLGRNAEALDHAPAEVPVIEAVRRLLDRSAVDPEVEALIQHAGVAAKTIQRAQRIRERLQTPRSLGQILIELGELSRDDYERASRRRRSTLSLVELLEEDGSLTSESREIYEDARRRDDQSTDRDLLVGMNLVSEEQFLRALCATLELTYQEPDIGAVNLTILGRTSFRWLLRHNVLPINRRDGKLDVVVSDPSDDRLLEELEQIFGMPLRISCCVQERIRETLNTLQRIEVGRSSSSSSDLSLQYRKIDADTDVEEVGEEAVQVVDYLLLRAIELGASDLHVEPERNRVRVRTRVDGVLHHLTDLPADMAPRVVSRIKILAGADIAERRLHQDGKICVRIESRDVDIRVSTYVSSFGETIVMRLLDGDKGILPLEKVGFTERAMATLTEVVLESSSGLVLLVGPTGSGKTTTLYSFIDHANDPTEKVITCEDPVEYVIEGIVQCSVNEKTGPTFRDSLRAIVRQDPDTIVVGEIRDGVTAGLALESALTGHKVFSTFHTEEAVGAFVRLLEMGVEPYLVASTVSAVVAQRLIRRVCDKCRKPAEPSQAEARFLQLERAQLRGVQLYQPGECAHCRGAGYRGRLAIHEVLVPNDDFREAVLRRCASKELREQARKLPEFMTMQEDGLLKAAKGSTTLAEVIANAPRDSSPRPLSTLQGIARLRRI
jgi:type IV pilus assembly protein PilB